MTDEFHRPDSAIGRETVESNAADWIDARCRSAPSFSRPASSSSPTVSSEPSFPCACGDRGLRLDPRRGGAEQLLRRVHARRRWAVDGSSSESGTSVPTRRSPGLVAAATAVMPLWVDPIAWLVLRAVVGFGCAGLFITTESWLNAKAPPAASVVGSSRSTWSARSPPSPPDSCSSGEGRPRPRPDRSTRSSRCLPSRS